MIRLNDDIAELAADESGQITVDRLKQQADDSQQQFVRQASDLNGVEVVNQFWIVNAVLVEVDTDATTLEELAGQEDVDRIHPDFEVELPEQPNLDEQVFEPEDVNPTYGLDQVNAPDVWEDFDTQGEGVEVAVLDTGVDPDHPDIDIEDDNWAEFDSGGNIVDDSEIRDTSDHGTHVSGTVVGGDASGTDIGVAPEATLMHGLVLPGGSGSFTQVAAGIEWAADEGADILNMSLGATGFFDAMIEPVQNAHELGTLVVASSGNSGVGTSGSPGNVFESFAVGASNEQEGITGFSSGEEVDTESDWGGAAPDEWPDEYVVPDVAAPGSFVLSAVPGNDWDQFSGTSMAAPHTAGAAALVLSASDEAQDPDTVQDAFEQIAFKPDDAPDEQDIRFGHGIIDARLTTEFLASQQGIEGTVIDEDGEPIEGEPVNIDQRGFFDETDADGAYEIRADAGEYELATDIFGFEDEVRDVIVPEDEFVTEDFELDRTLDIDLLEGQPDGAVGGDTIELTVRTAHLEALTIEQVGDYDEELMTLEVAGQELEFGETLELDGAPDLTATVTIETTEETEGTIELEHTFEGLGETIEVTTGPTVLAEEAINVGVVTDTRFNEADMLLDELDEELPGDAVVDVVDPENAVEAAESGDFDTLVAQTTPDDRDDIAAFRQATVRNNVGTVWLDTQRALGSLGATHSAIGFPPRHDGDSFSNSIEYEVIDEHPILEEVADVGEEITVREFQFGETGLQGATWMGGYQGQTLTEVDTRFGDIGGEQGLAVDDAERTVLAPSLAPETDIDAAPNPGRTDEASELVAAATLHTAIPTGAALQQPQPDHINPDIGFDEVEVEVVYDVQDLERYELRPADENTIDTDAIDVEINGKQSTFNQRLTYDSLDDESFTITLTIDTEQTGVLALEHDFVTSVGEDGEEREFTGFTGPSPMYVPPLDVPEEAANPAEINDMMVDGIDIEVGDGAETSVESVFVPEFKNDIEIRGLEDAEDPRLTSGLTFWEGLTDDQATVFLDGNFGSSVLEQAVDRDDIPEPGSWASDATAGQSELHIEQDHPLFDGVGEAGDTIDYTTGEAHPAFGVPLHAPAWFDDYGGEVLAEIGEVGGDIDGAAVGVHDEINQVLLSASARDDNLGQRHNLFTDEENQLLLNAVEYAAEEQAGVEDSTVDVAVVTTGFTDRETFEQAYGDIKIDGQSPDLDEIELTPEDEEWEEMVAFLDEELDDRFQFHPVGASELMDEADHDVYLLDEWIEEEDEQEALPDATVEVEGEDIDVTGLVIDGNDRIGAVDLRTTSDITVTDNTVLNTDVEDIDLDAPFEFIDKQAAIESFSVNDVVIEDNHIEGTDMAIRVDGPFLQAEDIGEIDSVISGNEIHDAQLGINVRDHQGVGYVVEDNHIEGFDWGIVAGIGLQDTPEGTAVQNNVLDGAGDGVGINVGEGGGGADEQIIQSNEISNVTSGATFVQFSEDNVVRDNHIVDSDVAVDFDGTDRGPFDAPVEGNIVTNNTAETDTGVLVRGDLDEEAWEEDPFLDPGDAESVVEIQDAFIHYNDFSGTDIGVTEDLDFEQDNETVDAILNYWGEEGTTDVAFEGETVQEPFLTVPPVETTFDPAEDETIGVDMTFEAGNIYSAGIPGPTDQTVADAFSDFEGVIYGHDDETNSWTQVQGDDELGALDAVVVVAQEDGHAVLTFDTEGVSGPGQTELEPGWNFVPAPAYDHIDDAFELATTEFTLAQGLFDQPGNQFGAGGDFTGIHTFGDDDEPTVSPFEGYFLFAEEEGTMPSLLASDPTWDDLYDVLGVEHPYGTDTGTETTTSGAEDAFEMLLSEVGTASELDVDWFALSLERVLIADLQDGDVTTTDEAAVLVEERLDELSEATNEAVEDEVVTVTGLVVDRLFIDDELRLSVSPPAGE